MRRRREILRGFDLLVIENGATIPLLSCKMIVEHQRNQLILDKGANNDLFQCNLETQM